MDSKRTKRYLIDLLINAAIIFVSYILAVVIRYYIFRPDPGVDPLSVPFLIIAFIYAILMSYTLDYEELPRSLQGDEIFTGISRTVSQNVIGCIVFLAVFFVTGIVNFSRWAIFVFGIISSVGLIAKQITVYSITARKRCAGKDVRNVLIVGEGPLAEEYIQSITNNPQFGVNILGYMGSSDKMETDLTGWFEPEKYPFPVIKWLGEYSIERIKDLKADHVIDEVVITQEISNDDMGILNGLSIKRISVALPYSNCIKHGSKIRDLGYAKLIRANDTIVSRDYSKAGLVVSVALLLIILLMKKFNLSTMDPAYTMRGIEKSRSIVFALFGFFLFWTISNKFGAKTHSLIRSAGITICCSAAFIGLYELAYGEVLIISFLTDFIPTVVVVGIYFLTKEAIKGIAGSLFGT